jgi:hypothetical protein
MKLTSSQDRAAVGAWIDGQADHEEGKRILAGLPRLQRGGGYIWSPGREVLQRVCFPAIRTFDSSRAQARNRPRASGEWSLRQRACCRALKGLFERLELCARKPACTVLRGMGGCKAIHLLDKLSAGRRKPAGHTRLTAKALPLSAHLTVTSDACHLLFPLHRFFD